MFPAVFRRESSSPRQTSAIVKYIAVGDVIRGWDKAKEDVKLEVFN
jgi:hypothetical protein